MKENPLRCDLAMAALCCAVSILSAVGCADVCDGEEALDGDLVIKVPADLTDLAGIRCITGDVLVGEIEHGDTGGGIEDLSLSASLVNLDGLEDIEIVEGDLHIAGNLLLTDLSGLSGLTHVGRELRLETKTPRGDLIIHQNALLDNLDDLSALQLVGANLIVSANGFLTSIDGMQSLEKVGWELKVINNPFLDPDDVEDFAQDVMALGELVACGNAGEESC